MGRAQQLYDALEAAERVLGDAVNQYRLALGCCATCGDFFEIGTLAIVMVDDKGRTCFEHEECPEEPVNFREDYRNPNQNGPLKPFSV
jgi:hypothetical protein